MYVSRLVLLAVVALLLVPVGLPQVSVTRGCVPLPQIIPPGKLAPLPQASPKLFFVMCLNCEVG